MSPWSAMDGATELETRRATLSDVDRSAEVLAAAFVDYPWTRWTVEEDDHAERIRALQEIALRRYGIPFGDVWVTLVSGAVQAVAVWMDSAVEVSVQVQEKVGPAIARLEGDRHDASRRATEQIDRWRPEDPHLYLASVGTHPSWQRRGLARRTLAPVLDLSEAAQRPVFVETSSPSNVDFYSSLGFDVVGHELIAGGGPDVWAMLRSYETMGA